MDSEPAFEDHLELLAWLDENLKVELPVNDETYLSIGCLDMAIEHYGAMLLLARSELYGSMFALARVMFEAVGRGLWLRHCATEVERKRFHRGKLDLTFNELLKQVEFSLSSREPTLSQFQSSIWGILNDLTHTGIKQVRSRHGDQHVGGNYSVESVNSMLRMAGLLAVLAAAELASHVNDPELGRKVVERAIEYAGRKP